MNPNAWLSGQYSFGRKIGEGGFGAVYKAEQLSTGRTVAVKFYKPHLVGGEREVTIHCKLPSHRNLVTIHDAGQAESGPFGAGPYLIMEYLTGGNLWQWMEKQGRFRAKTIITISKQLIRAVRFVHGRGIVHRDIKPQNMLLCRETGQFKLGDFGIARDLNTLATATHTQSTPGSVAFMAPEVAAAKSLGDKRSDLYSVGAVIYWLWTGGVLPLGRFKEPEEVNVDVPQAVNKLVLTLLEPDPDERPQTASQLEVPVVHNTQTTKGSRPRSSVSSERPQPHEEAGKSEMLAEWGPPGAGQQHGPSDGSRGETGGRKEERRGTTEETSRAYERVIPFLNRIPLLKDYPTPVALCVLALSIVLGLMVLTLIGTVGWVIILLGLGGWLFYKFRGEISLEEIIHGEGLGTESSQDSGKEGKQPREEQESQASDAEGGKQRRSRTPPFTRWIQQTYRRIVSFSRAYPTVRKLVAWGLPALVVGATALIFLLAGVTGGPLEPPEPGPPVTPGESYYIYVSELRLREKAVEAVGDTPDPYYSIEKGDMCLWESPENNDTMTASWAGFHWPGIGGLAEQPIKEFVDGALVTIPKESPGDSLTILFYDDDVLVDDSLGGGRVKLSSLHVGPNKSPWVEDNPQPLVKMVDIRVRKKSDFEQLIRGKLSE